MHGQNYSSGGGQFVPKTPDVHVHLHLCGRQFTEAKKKRPTGPQENNMYEEGGSKEKGRRDAKINCRPASPQDDNMNKEGGRKEERGEAKKSGRPADIRPAGRLDNN